MLEFFFNKVTNLQAYCENLRTPILKTTCERLLPIRRTPIDVVIGQVIARQVKMQKLQTTLTATQLKYSSNSYSYLKNLGNIDSDVKQNSRSKNAKMLSNVTLYGEWYLTQTGLAGKADRSTLKYQEKHHNFFFPKYCLWWNKLFFYNDKVDENQIIMLKMNQSLPFYSNHDELQT